jgi:hypothetical protein
MSLELTNHGSVKIGENVYPVLEIWKGASMQQVCSSGNTLAGGFKSIPQHHVYFRRLVPLNMRDKKENIVCIYSCANHYAWKILEEFLATGSVNMSTRNAMTCQFRVCLQEILSKTEWFIDVYSTLMRSSSIPTIRMFINKVKQLSIIFLENSTEFPYANFMESIRMMINSVCEGMIIVFDVTLHEANLYTEQMYHLFDEACEIGLRMIAFDESFNLIKRQICPLYEIPRKIDNTEFVEFVLRKIKEFRELCLNVDI